MKVSLAGIYDRGNLHKERVHFRADYQLNLSFYVLLDTVRVNVTDVSAGNLSAFWFPPRPIARGEHVVVYTRAGISNIETRPDGTIYHFLFRGLPNSLYARPEGAAVLMEVQTWVSGLANISTLAPLPAQTPLGLAGAPLPTYGQPSFNTGLGGLASGIPQLGDIYKPKS